MKTTTLSPETITINTLRERATEFLRVADNLEAQQKFASYSTKGGVSLAGITIRTIRTGTRRLSVAARQRIAKAQKARWMAKKKGMVVVGKAA